MSSKFTTTVQQYADTEDLFIEIPPYILKHLDWEENDELAWSIKQNQIILTKVKDSGSTKEEPTIADYDWYTVKEEAIKEHIEELTEHFFQDYDEVYDDYIEASVEEGSSLEGYEFTKD